LRHKNIENHCWLLEECSAVAAEVAAFLLKHLLAFKIFLFELAKNCIARKTKHAFTSPPDSHYF